MQLRIKATRPQAQFHQIKTKRRLFCAGYGAGKSEAMAQAVIMDACQSSQVLIGCYAPTYDLVRLITAPRIQEKLIDHGIPHKYNKAENVIYTSAPRWGDIILRTMDNPERIVGYETYRDHLDELDTLKFEHAKDVWTKVLGRNRQKPTDIPDAYNQVSAYTTPEGYKFCHWRWVQNKSPEYEMIQAPSYSNPYLPADYIQGLRDTYPDALVDAYIEGRFVNLTSGTVYNSFDRNIHHTNETIQQGEPLYIGMDFNVQNMAAIVHVKRKGKPKAVAEQIGLYDTPSMIEAIKRDYEGHKIYVYPDASGKSRKTVNASTNDLALLEQAGFIVNANSTNPSVKDRIVAMNNAFEHEEYQVNTRTCPEYTKCLEQQAYDRNGNPDKEGGYDHANDAAGYFISMDYPVSKPMFIPKIKVF